MIERSIVISPKFPNQYNLDELRNQYDPLASLIPPHITLVFPFESELDSDTLQRHVAESVRGMAPFAIRLQGVTGTGDGYLFLNVKQGNDEIIALHDRLYSGMLANYLYRKVTFVPHVTVGRCSEAELLNEALRATAAFHDVFETMVSEVCVETIGPDQRSNIEFCVPIVAK